MKKLNFSEINMISGGCLAYAPDIDLGGNGTISEMRRRRAESAKKCREAMNKGIPVNEGQKKPSLEL